MFELFPIILDRWAKLLVQYCLRLEPRRTVAIHATPLAEPLVRAVYAEVLRAGGLPLLAMTLPGLDRRFYELARDWQLDTMSPIQELILERVDARVAIRSEADPDELSGVDPEKLARSTRASAPSFQRFLERSASGEARWVVTLYPTAGYAARAGMPLDQFGEFVVRACRLDLDDPKEAWMETERRQRRLLAWLSGKRVVHVEGPGTDLRVSIRDRSFTSSFGLRNVPDGEVFTSPVEDTAEGVISFTVPASRHGTVVKGIRLQFERGRVVAASAEENEPFLHRMLDVDEGAKRIGELAFGTNSAITRPIGDALFDEKIGGTMHLALGASYPETGGTNHSALHWDLVCDLRDGGLVTVDGTPLLRDGQFLID